MTVTMLAEIESCLRRWASRAATTLPYGQGVDIFPAFAGRLGGTVVHLAPKTIYDGAGVKSIWECRIAAAPPRLACVRVVPSFLSPRSPSPSLRPDTPSPRRCADGGKRSPTR